MLSRHTSATFSATNTMRTIAEILSRTKPNKNSFSFLNLKIHFKHDSFVLPWSICSHTRKRKVKRWTGSFRFLVFFHHSRVLFSLMCMTAATILMVVVVVDHLLNDWYCTDVCAKNRTKRKSQQGNYERSCQTRELGQIVHALRYREV